MRRAVGGECNAKKTTSVNGRRVHEGGCMNATRLVMMTMWIVSMVAPIAISDATVSSISVISVGPSPAPNFSIAVSGKHLVDAKGNTVQLRGVNIGSLAVVAIQGWYPSDPWGG